MSQPTWWDRLASLVLRTPRTPEDERQDTKRLAAEAVRWLADDTLNAAVAQLRYETVEAWRTSKDPETRERAWLMMATIDGFVARLGAMIGDEEVLREQEARAERTRAAGL